MYYLIWSSADVTKRTTNSETNLGSKWHAVRPTLTNGEGINKFYFFPGETLHNLIVEMIMVGSGISLGSFVVVRKLVFVITCPCSLQMDSCRLPFAMMLPCLPTRLPYIDLSRPTPALKSSNLKSVTDRSTSLLVAWFRLSMRLNFVTSLHGWSIATKDDHMLSSAKAKTQGNVSHWCQHVDSRCFTSLFRIAYPIPDCLLTVSGLPIQK